MITADKSSTYFNQKPIWVNPKGVWSKQPQCW